jgi:hypothetical protein
MHKGDSVCPQPSRKRQPNQRHPLKQSLLPHRQPFLRYCPQSIFFFTLRVPRNPVVVHDGHGRLHKPPKRVAGGRSLGLWPSPRLEVEKEAVFQVRRSRNKEFTQLWNLPLGSKSVEQPVDRVTATIRKIRPQRRSAREWFRDDWWPDFST